MVLIGVDTGGTFTDLAWLDEEGRVQVHKVLSTPDNPARAVLKGLEELPSEVHEARRIVHGSTVATNALLERRGARTALITTAGFEDVLEIGRQTRPNLYDLAGKRPPPLVSRGLRFGLNERTLYDGQVEREADPEEIADLLARIEQAGVQSLAVCLLHSYANPSHEESVRRQADSLGIPVSVSHRIFNEFREYERTSTTVVNAYVSPLMVSYLGNLRDRLGTDRLKIMQSNGGAISVSAALERPVRTILSGPAGGVCGAANVAEAAGLDRIISFDMGGTSTDVSLYDHGIQLTSESVIEGIPIKVPMVRIHTVGAGGGSLARADAGGALRVGPRSAGADPGPVCYGKGDRITVTDANLFLGRLDPDYFLGGRMRIDPDKIEKPMADLASELGLSPVETAEGIVRVVNSAMEKAIRVITVERGLDPRDFHLVSFGGAGGLHACELADVLGIPEVLVPPDPGVLSALGMVWSDVIIDSSRTVMLSTESTEFTQLEMDFSPLIKEGLAEMTGEGFERKEVRIERSLDMRYAGQSFEIMIPFSADFEEQFHQYHQKLYGAMNRERPTEVVNLRLKLTGLRPKHEIQLSLNKQKAVSSAILRKISVIDKGEPYEADLVDRDALEPGHEVSGPAIVVEFSATTYVPSGFNLNVDERLNLILRKKK